jgi:hypothetical protein
MDPTTALMFVIIGVSIASFGMALLNVIVKCRSNLPTHKT